MNEYEKLYHRWKRYRRRRLLRRLLFILLGAGGIVGGGYYWKMAPEQGAKEAPTTSQAPAQEVANILLPSKAFEANLRPIAPPPRPSKAKAKEPTPPPQPKAQPQQSKGLVVIQEHTIDPQTLKASFQTHPKLSTALLLANYYYKAGDYPQAANWALKANEIDPESEESWLLFAKALAKKGERDRAITVLRLYMKKRKSAAAYELLDQIMKGEFR
ncbi:MAG: hypothetical protein C6I00_01635 [Nitratiruptor sp.]|nr:hypothetical protein [Nitratiruptor sp.]NPA83300.1 tetratricopeptide repeat protein [Campylobacterota bacterium]